MRRVVFTPSALQQLREWERNAPKVFNRIAQLVNAIQDSPFQGIGKPEALKHDLKGYWSRRITQEHRLVYEVTDKSIVIVACKYHYD